jgi:hypothetical protein
VFADGAAFDISLSEQHPDNALFASEYAKAMDLSKPAAQAR